MVGDIIVAIFGKYDAAVWERMFPWSMVERDWRYWMKYMMGISNELFISISSSGLGFPNQLEGRASRARVLWRRKGEAGICTDLGRG